MVWSLVAWFFSRCILNCYSLSGAIPNNIWVQKFKKNINFKTHYYQNHCQEITRYIGLIFTLNAELAFRFSYRGHTVILLLAQRRCFWHPFPLSLSFSALCCPFECNISIIIWPYIFLQRMLLATNRACRRQSSNLLPEYLPSTLASTL